MPAQLNQLDSLNRIDALRIIDAVAVARRMRMPDLPASWPKLVDLRCRDAAGIAALVQRSRSDPGHPCLWHRRAAERALAQPRARRMYFLIRRSLWEWPEFRGLTERARRILETVIELARDEAFPWFLNVQAREIKKLAQLSHESMARRLRELECFVITRPARRLRLPDEPERESSLDRCTAAMRCRSGTRRFVSDANEPLREAPQWVIRYRRGIPRDANRAAWWINCDLLCGTQRVLPCFEVCVGSLAKTYEGRNRAMDVKPGTESKAAFLALQRRLARDGPLLPPGLRAAPWEGA